VLFIDYTPLVMNECMNEYGGLVEYYS